MKRLLVSLVALAVAMTMGCAKKIEEHATISFFIGNVTKNGVLVNIGDVVSKNDVIATANMASCDIKIGDSMIRIKEKSNVVFSSLMSGKGKEDTQLGLQVGKMLCKPKKLLKDERFVVKTPTAVAGVRGTQFIVEADSKKTTRIKVFDGEVKVAKRIKAFEGKEEKVLESASVVSEKESAVVTVVQVQAAEKNVEKLILEGTSDDVDSVISVAEKDVQLAKENITAFKPESFAEESSEIIAVVEKPAEVIKEIKKVIEEQKANVEVEQVKSPEGRLLITRYEIYIIKDGKVDWEGRVFDKPLSYNNRIYVATNDYVFCASADGSIIWQKEIQNDGRVTVSGDSLSVTSGGKVENLDFNTGDIIRQ